MGWGKVGGGLGCASFGQVCFSWNGFAICKLWAFIYMRVDVSTDQETFTRINTYILCI